MSERYSITRNRIYKRRDVVGVQFGRLTVLAEAPDKMCGGKMRRFVVCRCTCGRIKEVYLPSLFGGKILSCGCLNRELVQKSATKHGMIGTPLYHVWDGMIQRCTNPKQKHYSNYGGRGITVCERWRRSFVAFLADMGPSFRPRLTLDRINNSGNYEPSNCRWVTRKVQQNNTRRNHLITAHGVTLNITEWAARLGVHKEMLHARIRAGWDPIRVICEPVHKRPAKN